MAAGMFHLSWAGERAAVAVLSGHGIYELARAVGVRFLDKLEACVDYRATATALTAVWTVCTMSLARVKEPESPKKDSVYHVIKMMRSIISAWLFHFRGMRLGRHDLQVRNGWSGVRQCPENNCPCLPCSLTPPRPVPCADPCPSPLSYQGGNALILLRWAIDVVCWWVAPQLLGLRALAPVFVMAGRPLYSPLSVALALDLTNNTDLAEALKLVASMPMSGGDEHQHGFDEWQEEMQRVLKALFVVAATHVLERPRGD